MSTEEAKEILAAFRPGTEDERDPIFADALKLMGTNAELKAWFEDTRAFDQLMKVELARVPAPADLRDIILASPKIIRPVPWWNSRLKGWHWAAAAAVVQFAAESALWYGRQPVTFGEFRREIADPAANRTTAAAAAQCQPFNLEFHHGMGRIIFGDARMMSSRSAGAGTRASSTFIN